MDSDSPKAVDVKMEARPISSGSSSPAAATSVASSASSASPVVKQQKTGPPSAMMSTCKVCGKTFCSVGALKRHNLSIHLKNEIFHCTVAECGRSFLLKEYLKKHLTRYHKMPPQFPRKKKAKNGETLRELMKMNAHASASSATTKIETESDGNYSSTSPSKSERPSLSSDGGIDSDGRSPITNNGRSPTTATTTPTNNGRSPTTPTNNGRSPKTTTTNNGRSPATTTTNDARPPDRPRKTLSELLAAKPDDAPTMTSPSGGEVSTSLSRISTTGSIQKNAELSSSSPPSIVKRTRKKRTSSSPSKAAASSRPDKDAKIADSPQEAIKKSLANGETEKDAVAEPGGKGLSVAEPGGKGLAVAEPGGKGLPVAEPGGKGKRRKQKRALVDGWMDPDELADDLWSPSGSDNKKTSLPAPVTTNGPSAPSINNSSPGGNLQTPPQRSTLPLTSGMTSSIAKSAPSSSRTPSKTESKKADVDFQPTKDADANRVTKTTLIDAHRVTKTTLIDANRVTKTTKKLKKKKKFRTPDPKLQELETESRQILSYIRGRDSLLQQQQQQQQPYRRSSTPPASGSRNLVYPHSSSSGLARGPVVRITNNNNRTSPPSAVVINHPDQLAFSALSKSSISGTNPGATSSKSGISYAGPFINEKIAKSLYNRPPTHFLLNYEDTHNWRCMLCGHGNFFDDLGQLFGPFHLAEAKLNADIFGRKNTVSLCRESLTLEDPASGISAGSSSLPQPCGRVVSGTKDAVTGGKSPTRRAISTSNIAAQRDSESSVVANPEPEPYEVWLHENCAVWSVGVYMVEGKIYGLEEALNLASETKCSRCSENGATLGCFKSCNANYHYRCARKNGCQFNERNFTIRCPKHAELASASLASTSATHVTSAVAEIGFRD